MLLGTVDYSWALYLTHRGRAAAIDDEVAAAAAVAVAAVAVVIVDMRGRWRSYGWNILFIFLDTQP